MTSTLLSSRIRRRRVPSDNTPLVRQWQLLQWLSSEPDGVTVTEAAEVTGMDAKTIRRDLVLLRRVGFDLEELVEEPSANDGGSDIPLNDYGPSGDGTKQSGRDSINCWHKWRKSGTSGWSRIWSGSSSG